MNGSGRMKRRGMRRSLVRNDRRKEGREEGTEGRPLILLYISYYENMITRFCVLLVDMKLMMSRPPRSNMPTRVTPTSTAVGLGLILAAFFLLSALRN